MIPKIVHYCWFGNPYPDDIKACMASWQKHLPDYEFMLWNFDRFDKKLSLWVRQTVEVKKYGFTPDYIRLYALYNYGGIYLDTDVEVLKSFDDLLDLPYFLGEEATKHGIGSAILGAEKGCFWIGKLLEYYQNKKFILGIGRYDMRVMPSVMKEIFLKNYTIIKIKENESITYNEKEIYIFPIDYFSPKEYDNPNILHLTKNTYTIHHFAGSWKKNRTRAEKLWYLFLGIMIKTKLLKLYQDIKKRRKIQ
jgi:hypothetical protein